MTDEPQVSHFYGDGCEPPHAAACTCEACNALRRACEDFVTKEARMRPMPTAGWNAITVPCPGCGITLETNDGGNLKGGHWNLIPLAADLFLHTQAYHCGRLGGAIA